MSKALRLLRPLLQNLSVKAGLYALAAVAASLVSVLLSYLVPVELAELLGGDAVDRILTILASSMLAVVTFSLSTLVASYATAANVAPPRATALIIEDSSARNSLSAFLGAFIFSIVSLVALSTKYYGRNGRVILFIITIGVLIVVILTMITWIRRLSEYSLLTNLIEKIEEKADCAVACHLANFAWHNPAKTESRLLGFQVSAQNLGFVRSIDETRLSELAHKTRNRLHCEVGVGDFVFVGTPLMSSERAISDAAELRAIQDSVSIGSERQMDQDPRFAFTILSEIGSKALSPGINDPGTAIQALASIVRLIARAKSSCEVHKTKARTKTEQEPGFFTARKITAAEIFDDSFRAIARDGRSMIEVIEFLQQALCHFGDDPDLSEAAAEISAYSYSLAESGLVSEHDLARLRRLKLQPTAK